MQSEFTILVCIILFLAFFFWTICTKKQKENNSGNNQDISNITSSNGKKIERLTEGEIGAAIYETLRECLVENNGIISYQGLLNNLKESSKDLPREHIIEVMAGLTYAAFLELHRQYEDVTANKIMDGIRKEFIKHLKEVDAIGNDQVDRLNSFLVLRWKEYEDCLYETKDRGQGLFRLSSNYYRNMFGKEGEDFYCSTLITQFFIAHKRIVKGLLEVLEKEQLTNVRV